MSFKQEVNTFVTGVNEFTVLALGPLPFALPLRKFVRWVLFS
jgi:hypothetical protein